MCYCHLTHNYGFFISYEIPTFLFKSKFIFFRKFSLIFSWLTLLKLPRKKKKVYFLLFRRSEKRRRRRKKIMFVKTEKFFGQFCGYTQSLSFLKNWETAVAEASTYLKRGIPIWYHLMSLMTVRKIFCPLS